MRYKISVRTLQGNTITFTVSSHTITPGGFVEFTDEQSGVVKSFHASNCEINKKGGHDE